MPPPCHLTNGVVGSEALSAACEAIRESETGLAHPASAGRFRTPTGNAGIHEISSAPQSCSSTAASACQGPPLKFSTYFRLFVSPPRYDGSLREGFDVGFPCLSACALLQFAFFVSHPRHTDGTREGFDGGLSRHIKSAFFGGVFGHSAFFGGLSCHSAFFVSPPLHAGGTRQVFDGWFAYYSVHFLQILFFAFFLAS